MRLLETRLLHQWASLPLRLIVGYGFIAHGWAKLSRGPGAFAVILHTLGVPAPHVLAWATTLLRSVPQPADPPLRWMLWGGAAYNNGILPFKRYILGEAYAFGVIWSFLFNALSMLMLRFHDKREREFKVPVNIRIGDFELPVEFVCGSFIPAGGGSGH